MENAATQKVEELWIMVEKFLYEEEEEGEKEEKDNQSLRGAILDECTQWKTQIPYLRIICRNPARESNTQDEVDENRSSDEKKILFDDLPSDKQLVERSSLVKVKN